MLLLLMRIGSLVTGAGGEISIIFFAQPDCPSRFAYQDQYRIKGLNAETLASAEYTPLQLDVIVALEWTEEWFFMNGRVHPYALAWEVKQQDSLESDIGRTVLYTIPALIICDKGCQPVLPRLFTSIDSFLCVPPVVSFTGPIVGPGNCLLRQDLLPGLDTTQLKCCGFIQLSTYLTPGNPDKTPFRGFYPFQVFVIFPIHTNPWAILCRKMTERRDSHNPAGLASLYTTKTTNFLGFLCFLRYTRYLLFCGYA
ncbi:hypothetical protein BGZ61DRAFT_499922 [Ilyonectria robusta]|uniref:uncharacterized protein n=1 Tax=Ilyonectria robusta TaxID=1079257 RepID=UPI001E8EE5B6|nr:uncharacterized protein BGZ61DRAFT_499922 [Ilyonectria robusta]KAH8658882.1 hypothetical protein BGZ61DRAFT_499922 [Ilyonectria robusta]